MTLASGGSVRERRAMHETVTPAPPAPGRAPRSANPPLPEGPDALPPLDDEQDARSDAARGSGRPPSASTWFG